MKDRGPLQALPDPVDAAIERVEGAPVQIEMAQQQLALGGNPARPIVFMIPLDFTDVEALQAVQALLMAMDRIRSARPASRIIVPGPNGRLT